jgi:peptidoglycan/LPS O-acetylase OafA/YrhL
MTKHDELPPDLDPEVAALVAGAKAAAEEKKARKLGVNLQIERRPTELNLKLGPTAMLCLGAGVLSAAGAILLFNWPDANFFHLLLAQLPAAALIAAVYARAEKEKREGAVK